MRQRHCKEKLDAGNSRELKVVTLKRSIDAAWVGLGGQKVFETRVTSDQGNAGN